MNFILRIINKFKPKKNKTINEDFDYMLMHPFMPDGSIGDLNVNSISSWQIGAGCIAHTMRNNNIGK